MGSVSFEQLEIFTRQSLRDGWQLVKAFPELRRCSVHLQRLQLILSFGSERFFAQKIELSCFNVVFKLIVPLLPIKLCKPRAQPLEIPRRQLLNLYLDLLYLSHIVPLSKQQMPNNSGSLRYGGVKEELYADLHRLPQILASCRWKIHALLLPR